jgi:hypothetical protein
MTTGALRSSCFRIASRTANLRASSIRRPSAKIWPIRRPCLAFIACLRPDTPPEITVCLDVLEEIDGPMLQHGLQGFRGRRVHVPRADRLLPTT